MAGLQGVPMFLYFSRLGNGRVRCGVAHGAAAVGLGGFRLAGVLGPALQGSVERPCPLGNPF